MLINYIFCISILVIISTKMINVEFSSQCEFLFYENSFRSMTRILHLSPSSLKKKKKKKYFFVCKMPAMVQINKIKDANSLYKIKSKDLKRNSITLHLNGLLSNKQTKKKSKLLQYKKTN